MKNNKVRYFNRFIKSNQMIAIKEYKTLDEALAENKSFKSNQNEWLVTVKCFPHPVGGVWFERVL